MNQTEKLVKCTTSLINEWAESKDAITNGPWLVYIGVTNICNIDCAVCARQRAMRFEKGLMSFDVFKKIVDQLPLSVRKVYLMKQGEPLLHPEFERFVGYLRQVRPDIFISFHTNGIRAVKSRMRDILPLIDSLGISISAISRETYRKVHGQDKFETVTANIADISQLLELIDPDKRPHVFIDYVRQKANSSDGNEEVVNFFKENFNGLDSVDIHAVYNFQGEIDEGYTDVYERFDYSVFPCCVWPWSSITFCYDGKVSYCFVEPRENRFIGDITQESFQDIWNGEQFVKFRQRMANKEFKELADDGFYCNKCSWLWNMRSQSPRNLAGGYSSQKKFALKSQHFGDILTMTRGNLLELGTELYLEGEMHMAIACFNVLLSTTDDTELRSAASMMLEKCGKVLDKFRNLSIWQKDPSLGSNALDNYNPLT